MLADLLGPYIEATLTELRTCLPPLATHPSFYKQLYYHLGWIEWDGREVRITAGKRIRAAFCLIACELFAGEYRTALPAACAVELLHGFSLIHDDIEDGDRTRHHRPTLWTLTGQPQAINAGDGMFALAQLALLRSVEVGVPAERVIQAQKRFNEAAMALCIGQHLDMSFEGREVVSPDEYLEMIKGKTASLLSYAGEVGALMGGATPQQVQIIAELGEAMGMAFQMRDDMLGIWGNSAVTGKPVGADIRAKKKSLPVSFALSQKRSDELRSLYREPIDDDETVGWATELITRTGAREYVTALAQEHEERVQILLDALHLPTERVQPLRQLAGALAQRTF